MFSLGGIVDGSLKAGGLGTSNWIIVLAMCRFEEKLSTTLRGSSACLQSSLRRAKTRILLIFMPSGIR